MYKRQITEGASCELYSFGMDHDADFRAEDVECIWDESFVGTRFKVAGKENMDVRMSIPGRFNVANGLAALAVSSLLGLPKEKICHGLEHIHVNGRMEIEMCIRDRVKTALLKARGENFEVLCETIKKTAFKITRVGQLVAQEASRRLNVPFGIIDLSLAPTPAVGDSVAEILEEIGLERVGAPGTTAALALLNDQVKKGGVMASSYVGGLSGAFIPVSEDKGMIDAVSMGACLLYTSRCV